MACAQLTPEWIFVKGVAASEDLPLNISSETQKHNNILRAVKQALWKCREMSAGTAEKKDDYMKCYGHLSKNVKFGIHEDSTNKAKIANLMRFETLRKRTSIAVEGARR